MRFFDRIYRMIRIFFAFPEERQKWSILFEGGTTSHGEKVVVFSALGGLFFITFIRKVMKIKNPVDPVEIEKWKEKISLRRHIWSQVFILYKGMIIQEKRCLTQRR